MRMDHRKRSYIIISAITLALIATAVFPAFSFAPELLLIVGALGAVPTFSEALEDLVKERKISIAVFNVFAIAASIVSGEWRSTAFIVLMLSCAYLLESITAARSGRAVEELLKLKPSKAIREDNGVFTEVPYEKIREKDILIIKNGERIPVDGRIVFGHAYINESSVTGETLPKERSIGDIVISSTLNESGMIKIMATNVGKDSTIERIANLIKTASENKSRAERVADRFASGFLPFIIIFGLVTYYLTKDIRLVTGIFLVACADDLAVATPLAITAAIGRAAKRGVIIKGGERFEALSQVDTVVLDKTGTLTHGTFSLAKFEISPDISENVFWESIASSEKFSEHPLGKALFQIARKHGATASDPDEFGLLPGGGITARVGQNEIIIGNMKSLAQGYGEAGRSAIDKLRSIESAYASTTVAVIINKVYAGIIVIADTPREEAKKSIEKLHAHGITPYIFTGDNIDIARNVGRALGIRHVRASMLPNDKVREVAKLSETHKVVMVGDGINDAPALARAHVGIAMGGIGTAVATEAADAVILSDNLDRLPEMVELSKNTISVLHTNIAVWFFSNLIGFTLVLTSFIGPAGAAFYNFITDFLPILNSTRLFKTRLELK